MRKKMQNSSCIRAQKMRKYAQEMRSQKRHQFFAKMILNPGGTWCRVSISQRERRSRLRVCAPVLPRLRGWVPACRRHLGLGLQPLIGSAGRDPIPTGDVSKDRAPALTSRLDLAGRVGWLGAGDGVRRRGRYLIWALIVRCFAPPAHLRYRQTTRMLNQFTAQPPPKPRKLP